MSNTTIATPPVKRKRGRPRKPFSTVVVHIRLPPAVFDAYDRIARKHDRPLNSVIAHYVTKHAPGRKPAGN